MRNPFMQKNTSLFVSALVACISILPVDGASAASRIYSPYVTPGELEAEYFGSRSVDSNSARNNKQKHQFSIGYGMNEWWKTEFYSKFEKEPNNDLTFDEWEWENIFQFTQRGEYWLDAGASVAYEWTPQSSRADTVEARLLLAKDTHKTSHILNIVAEKNVGSGPKEAVEGKLLWSSRYNYSRYFEPGFEIESDFGELKETGSFNDQKHYIGPAAYGKIPLHFTAHADAFKYRAGYLFGLSKAANNGEALIHLEYELHF